MREYEYDIDHPVGDKRAATYLNSAWALSYDWGSEW